MENYDISERRVCRVYRNAYRYKSSKDGQACLRMRIREIAETRIRFGYRRIHILLQREGWKINHKRVYRLYCEEGLHLRKKSKKRQKNAVRTPITDLNSSLNRWMGGRTSMMFSLTILGLAHLLTMHASNLLTDLFGTSV